MFKSKEIGRTWTVHRDKIPDLSESDYVEQSIIVLSTSGDSLQVTINKEVSDSTVNFYIAITDLSGNKLAYLVSEEDFEQSKELVGKVLNKRVFIVKSSIEPDRTIQLDIYKELKLIVANYYATSNTLVQTLPLED